MKDTVIEDPEVEEEEDKEISVVVDKTIEQAEVPAKEIQTSFVNFRVWTVDVKGKDVLIFMIQINYNQIIFRLIIINIYSHFK